MRSSGLSSQISCWISGAGGPFSVYHISPSLTVPPSCHPSSPWSVLLVHMTKSATSQPRLRPRPVHACTLSMPAPCPCLCPAHARALPMPTPCPCRALSMPVPCLCPRLCRACHGCQAMHTLRRTAGIACGLCLRRWDVLTAGQRVGQSVGGRGHWQLVTTSSEH